MQNKFFSVTRFFNFYIVSLVSCWSLINSAKFILFVKLFSIEKDGFEFYKAKHAISCSVMLYDHVVNIFTADLSTKLLHR